MANDQVRFGLRAITVEQFAMLFEPTNQNDTSLDISLSIKGNYDDRAVALTLTIRFVQKNRPFLLLENTCHFLVHEEDWNRLSKGNTVDVKLPKKVMTNLFSIAVGTARGILHAKTEQTPYNRFFLPLLDAAEMINESVTIKKSPEN
ncbi:MAG: hypothetical protein NC209_05570 [Alistipes sp.]|nr:hypothetical protein [Alistipes senegalensis]MCM1250594.1 hypothetical protein [Alistipes sp.]